jgi:hypothetical protein
MMPTDLLWTHLEVCQVPCLISVPQINSFVKYLPGMYSVLLNEDNKCKKNGK